MLTTTLRFPSRRYDLLAEVEAAGRCLDVQAWRALGLAFGYQLRGLAGFFGGREPSMVSRDSLRCLTDRGRQRLSEHH